MADQSKFFRLQVISPDRIFYDGDVEMVELTTSEGDMGVLKGHIPLTAILVPGILKIKEDGQEKKAAIHDGFVNSFSFDHVGRKVTLVSMSPKKSLKIKRNWEKKFKGREKP